MTRGRQAAEKKDPVGLTPDLVVREVDVGER